MVAEKHVKLGKNCKVYENVILGKVPEGFDGEIFYLEIGDNALIRAFSVIYCNTTIGNNFKTGFGVMIRENNKIGDDVSIGTHSELGPENVIENNVRIHSACFLEGVTLKQNVFIGPGVFFTNDPHPACPKYEECERGAVVEDNVSIGANSTILPGVKIGKNSLIGAGTVVTKDVPPNSVVVGNPGKVIKKVDELSCHKGFFKKPYEWREK